MEDEQQPSDEEQPTDEHPEDAQKVHDSVWLTCSVFNIIASCYTSTIES